MATTTSTALSVTRREPSGSRSVRRLRRDGRVPGIVYGGGQDPIPFEVDARELRHALSGAGALFDLSVDGAGPTPVMIKELVRHPVNGTTMHLDLLRVRLDRPIQAGVVLELTGIDDAPGVRQGGILEHTVRELTVEALPNDIPDVIQHDVSTLAIGDTLTVAQLTPPPRVTLVDDPETLIAAISAPRLQAEAEEEIEQETQLVAEGTPAADVDAAGGEAGGDESAE